MRALSTLLLCLITAAALPAAPKLPRPAGEFVVSLSGGEQHPISMYRGKVVVLAIVLTTCPHCQQAATILQKLMDEYASKGLQVLGAAINEEARTDLPRFIYRQGVKFPTGTSTREQAYAYLQADLSPAGPPVYMPQLVFIDRKGVIRAQYGGTDPFFLDEEKNLRNLIESLLKEPATTTTKGKK